MDCVYIYIYMYLYNKKLTEGEREGGLIHFLLYSVPSLLSQSLTSLAVWLSRPWRSPDPVAPTRPCFLPRPCHHAFLTFPPILDALWVLLLLLGYSDLHPECPFSHVLLQTFCILVKT